MPPILDMYETTYMCIYVANRMDTAESGKLKTEKEKLPRNQRKK